MKKNRLGLLALGLGIASFLDAQTIPSIDKLSDGIHHWNLGHPERTYARYTPEQYKEIADNFIAYQNKDGGWPKNIDWLAILPTDSVRNTLKVRERQSTLDNRNTYSQIDYLAQVYTLTKQSKYKNAVVKGLNYLLKTQKKNGGWRGWDVDAITYNDEVTTGVLALFLRINEGDINYTWLDDSMKKKIHQSLQKGIGVILRTQYVQNGVKTVSADSPRSTSASRVQTSSHKRNLSLSACSSAVKNGSSSGATSTWRASACTISRILELLRSFNSTRARFRPRRRRSRPIRSPPSA